MKKIFLFILLNLCFTNIWAQDIFDDVLKNEFQITIGDNFFNHLFNDRDAFIKDYSHNVDDIIDLENIDDYSLFESQELIYLSKKYWTPSFGLNYSRKICPKISLGAQMVYALLKETYTERSSKVSTTYTDNMFSILFLSKFNWVNGVNFGFYQSAAFGLYNSFREAHDNVTKFAYQVSLAGLRFGSQSLFGTIELGFGNKGIFNIGLSYRF